MDAHQQRLILFWAREAFQILGHADLLLKVDIQLNGRFTSRMGDAARLKDGSLRIRFSIPLWLHASEDERRQTVIHEVCHIVDMANETFRKDDAHGRSWQSLMIKCGVDPKRYHQVDCPEDLKRNVQRFQARCGCKTYSITSHRRTKMLKGRAYRCRLCNQLLKLEEI